MILIAVYIAAMVAANMLIALFGPWFSPLNAFFLIGLDLVIRDKLHDRWKGAHLPLKMFGLILTASAITYFLNPAASTIAVASVIAFIAAMVVNTIIYHFIQHKKWMVRSNVSNIGGALADSVTFPTIAFGVLMPDIIALQFICKVGGGVFWSFLFKKMGGVNE